MVNFFEKDLEDIIFENQDTICSKGLDLFRHDLVLRQVNLGIYGFADLIGLNVIQKYGFERRKLIITVYELKQKKINYECLGQAYRYVEGVKRTLRKNKVNLKNTDVYYMVCLIGNTVELEGDVSLCFNEIGNLFVYTYKYGINGIEFTSNIGYYITENSSSPAYMGNLADFYKKIVINNNIKLNK